MKIGSISFKNALKFKYLEAIVTNQNYIYEEVGRILNCSNTHQAHHSIQNSSSLLSKNLRIKAYRTVFLGVVW
jgi:hypothetical protein